MFIKVPDGHALKYGLSAWIGELCLDCNEVMVEIKISDEDVAKVVEETRIIPEVFGATPFDPEILVIMEEELEEAFRRV